MMGRTYRRLAALAAAMVAAAAGAKAQGGIVFDPSAFGQMVTQLAQMKAQFEQMKATHDGFNKLTGMGDIAGLLNDPAIRNALPKDFASLEGSLRNGGGTYGEKYLGSNETYVSPGNDYYAKTLQRQAGENAGQMGLAQQVYDSAEKRVVQLDKLRGELANSQDMKTTADLQAAIQLAQADLQIKINQAQALQMLQQARAQVEATNLAAEQKRKEDRFKEEFPPTSAKDW